MRVGRNPYLVTTRLFHTTRLLESVELTKNGVWGAKLEVHQSYKDRESQLYGLQLKIDKSYLKI